MTKSKAVTKPTKKPIIRYDLLSPKGKKTREEILLTAAGLFANHGYSGTGLQEIAASASVTKGSLYYHFEGKRHIYTECVSLVVDDAFDVARHPKWSVTSDIRLKQYLRWVLSAMHKSSLARQLLLRMVIDHDVELMRRLMKGPMGYSLETLMDTLKGMPLKKDKAVLAYFFYAICLLNDEFAEFSAVWLPSAKNKVGNLKIASDLNALIKSW
jgi:AcrR family transcriptional regulator